MHLPDKKGFTLVELMVVISIIAILSVVGIAIFTQAQKAARDGRRRGDLNALAKAIEQYKLVNGRYPAMAASSADSSPCGQWSTWAGWTLTGCGLTGYIQDMPKDPINNDDGSCGSKTTCHLYRYCSDTNGTYFLVGVNLENGPSMGTDPFGCNISQTSGSNLFWIRNQQ